MVEIDNSKAKAMALGSAHVNPNSELTTKTSKTKEEGELSSSDDDEDEHPVCSAAQSSGTAVAHARSILVPSANKYTQNIQAGRTVSGNNLASSIDVQYRTVVQPNNPQNFEKKPFKSANPGWYAPSGDNNNLVIRFSDDDSGSDSEDYRQKKASEIKSNSTGVEGNRRPPASSLAKLNKLQQNSRNVNKVIPNKLSLSRTFVSSTTKIQGGASSRGAGPSAVELGSRVRNSNTLGRNLTSQERGFDQGVGLNNNKLMDLRQQIALRESELKLKAAQQNKESVPVPVPFKDYDSMKLRNDAARKYNATSADVAQLEPKEPDKKRLKVSVSSYSTQLNSDARQEIPAAKSILPSKEPALENSSLKDRNKVDLSQKGTPMHRIESSIVKWKKQDDKRVTIPSENPPSAVKDGADVNASCNQSDKRSGQVDPSVVLNKTAPLMNMNSNTLQKNLNSAQLNHPNKSDGHHPPNSSLNEAIKNTMKSGNHQEVIAVDKPLRPSFNNMHQESLNNASLWNCMANGNISGRSNINIQSLVDMEELLDKELGEAQEHRRVCEIEERNALKAYRKAQRALIEANATCKDLYHRRELCSDRFRSFIMDDSSSFWTSGQHEHVGMGLDSTNLIPTSSHQMQPGYNSFNQQGYDGHIQCVNDAPLQHANGQILGSEPCSEPDVSTSEQLPRNSKNATTGVSSPSNDPNISADEDEETFPLDDEFIPPNFEYQRKEQDSEGRQQDTIHESNKKITDSSRDSFLLEATLRSELFARLGMRTLSKRSGSSYNIEPAVEPGTENEDGSEKPQMSNGSVLSSEAERSQQYDLGGTDRPERNTSKASVQIQNQCHVEKGFLEFHPTADSEDNGFSNRGHHPTTSVMFSPPILRSVFSHMKVMSPITSMEIQTRHQWNNTYNFHNGEGSSVNSEKIQWSDLIVPSMQETIRGLSEKGIGSYTCNIAVDPFWPLCMYELRGKCNNDECHWQHVKDFSTGNMYQHRHDDSDSADCQVGLALHQRKRNNATELSKCHDVLTPTYLVGLDILKANPHSYESVVAWRDGQCWEKCFSISLALSSLLKKDLPADESFLHVSDGRIVVHGSWNRQSSFFQSRTGVVNQLKQGLYNNGQFLEMALLILNQEANKLEGIKKALSMLSRALEADPTSEILWIVYLLIYYSNTKSAGKFDMFSYAVTNNEGSYGLWLMYINSRMKLDDRLAAYDAALLMLCRHASASGRDKMHASACILDLFLQLMDCLCMSGNVERAFQRIYGLFPSARKSDEPHSLLLYDILTCLIIHDKCLFWVCCIYFVIYRKLPDAVLQRFEGEKDLVIEWPSIHLVDDEKQRAIKLVDMGVDSIELCVNSELCKSEFDLRSVQLFALNHIRCMVALDGLECSKTLLEKYIKIYPSCLELVLISARVKKNDSGDLSFIGFEEALSKWSKEIPRIQCIWNQYAEYALQNGRVDFAQELMARWFNSVWKVHYHQNEFLDAIGGDNSRGFVESVLTPNPDFSPFNQVDVMFGFLNLSLHKLLQNDHIEARLAIDRALKAAAPENFKHCMREHAMFLLNYESQLKEDAPISLQLNILNSYLDNARRFPVSVPLSRQFINNIEKPKVQQLVTNILSPVSFDFSLVNLVLEVWNGPSLLPQKLSKPKDLVDFVEAILGIVPSNYPLALSVCNLLSRGYDYTDATPASVLFWASSILVDAIFNAIPIAPEYVWVEAAGILSTIKGIESISERFFKKALSAYPFSIKLWKFYCDLSKTTGDMSIVLEAAREKGIEPD